jgi:KilA-N domain
MMTLQHGTLVEIKKGGDPKLEQGTWAHPQVAIHCAQWCSPEFAVLVTRWVFEWMSQGRTPQDSQQPTDQAIFAQLAEEIAVLGLEPITLDLAFNIDTLVAETNQLYGEFEVAVSNPTPALQIAKDIGDRLLQLKEQIGHGNWEAFRQERIKSPHTGQPMPSSTASLYQRIAKNWETLKSVNVTTLPFRRF